MQSDWINLCRLVGMSVGEMSEMDVFLAGGAIAKSMLVHSYRAKLAAWNAGAEVVLESFSKADLAELRTVAEAAIAKPTRKMKIA